MTRALITQMLEAMEEAQKYAHNIGKYLHGVPQAITAAREYLAAPEQEPVAYLAWSEGKPCYEGDDAVCEDAVWPVDGDDNRTSMPVYTHPATQPAELTDGEILSIWAGKADIAQAEQAPQPTAQKDWHYVVQLLVAAGHITQAKVDEACAIAAQKGKHEDR